MHAHPRVCPLADRLDNLMRSAVYTLCPPGDVPERGGMYQALRSGSIPILNGAVHPPGARLGILNWSSFSVPAVITPQGTLQLPSSERERELRQGAHAHAHAFDCVRGNKRFYELLVASFRKLRHYTDS